MVKPRSEKGDSTFARLLEHLPRQSRSRRTLSRLLDAGQAVLADGDVEAATVPRIARRAGLSVGVVYRRFRDKDALVQAVYARFFEQQRERNLVILIPEKFRDATLPAMARGVIGGMVGGYRQHRGFLRSFLTYARSHPDSNVRRRAQEMTRAMLPRITEVLMLRRDEIRHPDPPAAIRFGLTAVALAAQSIVLLEEPLPRAELPPGRCLEDELTRLFLGYLGVPPEEAGAGTGGGAGAGGSAGGVAGTGTSARPGTSATPGTSAAPGEPDAPAPRRPR